jgi:hypothetical protein
MLAEALYRLDGSPAVMDKSPFSDASAASVIWANGSGIVNGTGDGFAPDADISREQLVVMLYRYAKWAVDSGQWLVDGGTGTLSKFPDADDISDWASDAVIWAVDVGLIQGRDDGLAPQGTATRAEVATILMRFMQNVI